MTENIRLSRQEVAGDVEARLRGGRNALDRKMGRAVHPRCA